MSEPSGDTHVDEEGTVDEQPRHHVPIWAGVSGVAVMVTVWMLIMRWSFSTQTTCTVPDISRGAQMCFPPDTTTTAIGNWTAGVVITAAWLLAVPIIVASLTSRRKPSAAKHEGALR